MLGVELNLYTQRSNNNFWQCPNRIDFGSVNDGG